MTKRVHDPSDLFDDVAAALSATLGRSVTLQQSRSIGGGCISQAARVETSSGPFFVKWSPRPLPGMFEREAEALRALRAADSGLVIPEPVCTRLDAGRGPAFLVLEYLPTGSRQADFDARLGRGLATLHRSTADAFGFDHDNFCGATPQPNGWMPRWVDFYRERRLGHQLDLAVRGPGVSKRDRRAFETLLDRLDDLLGPATEPPALIHGDLWGGNLHVAADGAPGILDPAAYYGHREAELGMMVLFGGFSRAVFRGYDEAWPLAPGWEDRIELYTLYHVMNHYNLFGGGYGAQAFQMVRKWVG